MTTASDLIERTKSFLYSGFQEEVNRLSADITSGATTIGMTYSLGGITAGSVIAIDLEEILVFAVDSTGKNVTDCVRGANGTTAASHTANTVVTVRPKFSAFKILQAINEDLLEISSPSVGLFQLKTEDLTYNPAKFGYDLPDVTDIIDIAEIRFRLPGPNRTWPLITKYALVRDHGGFSSSFNDFSTHGFGLVLYEVAQAGFPIRMKYRAPYAVLVNTTDDVLTVSGLQTRAHDLPPMGAAVRLMAGRDVKRSFIESQGEPRRSEEVPVGSAGQSVKGLMMARQARLQAELGRLSSDYPRRIIGAPL